MKLRNLWLIVASLALCTASAFAQESSYTPGTVWSFSYIKVEPGQMERYMDWLAGDWKRLNEFGKKEGYIVSYHVFSVSSPRAGDPDLILAVEAKDYYSTAQQREQQKRLEAFLKSDTRQLGKEYGERLSMRKDIGGMEMQELVLK